MMVRCQSLIWSYFKNITIWKLCLLTIFISTGSVLFVHLFRRGKSAIPNTRKDENFAVEPLKLQGTVAYSSTPMDTLNIGTHRLVHLDLKGAPPKVSYFKKLFPVLKEWGATGLLIEWEDTFPYWGAELSIIGSSGPDSPGVYSQQEVQELLSLAAQHDLDVIPLVQTFGHFEFVLKHDAFRSLREVEKFPSSLCPSQHGSFPLIQAMLTQILQIHPGIKILHVGADEVWHMGLCDLCRQRMAQMPASHSSTAKDRLFLEHVTSVLQWLKQNYPSLQLLMWDDMLRHMDPLLLQEFDLGKLVEPMVWHYRPAKSFHLPPDLWTKYSTIFNGVWIASAFKGASGSNVQLPDISQHLDCQESWIRELRIQQEKGTLPNVRGVAITGWSRYDHYAVMCELLPSGLPSLALCLAQWEAGGFTPEVHRQVSHMLGYPEGELVPVHNNHQLLMHSPPLTFPGWKIKSGIEGLITLLGKVNSIADSEQAHTWLNQYLINQSFSNPARIVNIRRKIKRVQSWLSPWLAKRNFTNPMQITSLCYSVPKLLDEMASVERFLRPALEYVLPPLVVEEWFGTILEPSRERLRQLLHDAEKQVALGGRIRGYHGTS